MAEILATPDSATDRASGARIDGRHTVRRSESENLNPRRRVRFIRLPEVKEITGLGKTTLYGMIKSGEFPSPVKIGGRAVGWIEHEVVQWVNDRVATARLNPPQQTDRLAA